jgi:hypothetical protein
MQHHVRGTEDGAALWRFLEAWASQQQACAPHAHTPTHPTQPTHPFHEKQIIFLRMTAFGFLPRFRCDACTPTAVAGRRRTGLGQHGGSDGPGARRPATPWGGARRTRAVVLVPGRGRVLHRELAFGRWRGGWDCMLGCCGSGESISVKTEPISYRPMLGFMATRLKDQGLSGRDTLPSSRCGGGASGGGGGGEW